MVSKVFKIIDMRDDTITRAVRADLLTSPSEYEIYSELEFMPKGVDDYLLLLTAVCYGSEYTSSTYDPLNWRYPVYRIAHQYIIDNFASLISGDTIKIDKQTGFVSREKRNTIKEVISR